MAKQKKTGVRKDKTQCWYVDGKLHRVDGPAVIWPNGQMWWCLDHVIYSDNRSFQEAAGLSDEEMTVMILKYGDIRDEPEHGYET